MSVLAWLPLGLVVFGLFWLRRWIFLIWTIVRPAAWPMAWGLLLLIVLGLVSQGQAIVQRALESGAGWSLVVMTLVASGLMGYAAASLLFVRCDPILDSLATARAQLKLAQPDYDRWCDRARRIFPILVLCLPWLAILPGALLLVLPEQVAGMHPENVARTAQLSALVLVVAGGWLAADTRLLRAQVPPRRRWLWPLRYPRLSDAAIDEAFADAAGHVRFPHLRRAGDRLLAGMLPGTRWVFTTAFVVACFFFLAALVAPPRVLELMGTASIVMAAAASLAVTGALAAHYINRHYSVTLPYLLAVLLLGAGLLARWGITDNHAVRLVVAGPERTQEQERAFVRPTLEEHLATWLAARRRDDGQPIPLIVAAAEGGGIRAALWTALALGELQGRLPRLPCDLFAIVGVSGGSVGAATYAAMLAQEPAVCGPDGTPTEASAKRGGGYARQASAAFSHDLLAPVAAGLFFPDLAARFLPPLGWPDRQLGLEQGWEAAWQAAAPDAAQLDQPFLALFEQRQDQMPALFMVASEVEGGRRWIASNVRIDRNTFADAVDTLAGRELFDSDALTKDNMIALPASAAAGLSARFPYVSPAGTLATASGVWHLLDGGIVESSGAATAGEILLALRSHCSAADGFLRCRIVPADAAAHQPRAGVARCDDAGADCILVRPAVIQLTNDRWATADTPPPDPAGLAAYLSPSFPETLGPLTALLASRTGRGRAAHDRLQGDPFLLAGGTCTALDIVLNPEGSELADPGKAVPLGWTLRLQHVEAMQQAITSALDTERAPNESVQSFARWRRDLYDAWRCPEQPPAAPPVVSTITSG